MFAHAGNQIGVEGARALAEALKTNNALTTISLSRMIACDAVLNVLIDVALAGNRIGDEGSNMILRALMTNVGVTVLSLDGNGVSETVARSIDKALQANKARIGECFIMVSPLLISCVVCLPRNSYNGRSSIRICSSCASYLRHFVCHPMLCWRLSIGCRHQTPSKTSMSTSHACIECLTSTRSACWCDFRKCTTDCWQEERTRGVSRKHTRIEINVSESSLRH